MLVKNADDVEAIHSSIIFQLEASKDGVVVTIKENRDPRSNAQNSFMWVAIVTPVTEVMNDAGETYNVLGDDYKFDEAFIHKACKKKLPINPETGLRYESTTDLNKKEFSEYLEEIIAHWTIITNGQWEFDESNGRG